MTLYDSIEKFADKLENKSLLGSIYRNRGYYYLNNRDYEKAILQFTTAIKYFNTSKSKITSYLHRGHSYKSLGKYNKALNDYSSVDTIYQKLKKIKKNYFIALGSKANIYGEIGLFKEVIDIYNLIIDKRKEEKILDDIGYDFYNLGITFKKIGNTKKCLTNILTSIEYSKKQVINKKPIIRTTAYRSLVISYSYLTQLHLDKEIKKAKQYLDSTTHYFNKLNKNDILSSEYNKVRALFFFKTNQSTKALKILSKELKIAKSQKNISTILSIEKSLHKIYLEKQDFVNAHKHLKSYQELKDSISSIKKSSSLIYYQTLYETELKEKEIISQQNDIKILANKNKAKKRYLIFGGIGLILIFSTILLYRNKKQLLKDKKNQEIYSKNLLVTQDKERERISKDLHDGLGQNLLLVKNKLKSKKNTDAINLLDDAIEEMRSVSRILYPTHLIDAGITLALKNLISQLDTNYKNIYIFGDIENFDKILSKNKELNVFRIIQESLTNIIKHAKAKSAKVTILNKSKEIVIEIRDNGIGFNFSERYYDYKSLGLKTIKKRVDFLKGSLTVESKEKKGTLFLIKLPI